MFSKDAKAYKHTIPESLYKTSSRNENNNIHPFIFKKNPNCLNTRKRHKIRIIQHQQRKKQLDQTTSVKEDFSRRIFLKLLRKPTTSILSPTLYTKSSRNKNDNIHQFIFQKNPNRLNRKETPQNSQHSKPARKKTAGAVNLREGGFF